jgi:hypothetical protein
MRNNTETVGNGVFYAVPAKELYSEDTSRELVSKFIRDKPIFSSARVQLGKKNYLVVIQQAARRQDELIGGKPPIIK